MTPISKKELNTIGDLNKKRWYRLLKVIFVLCFVIILFFISNRLSINDQKQIVDSKDSRIVCRSYLNNLKAYPDQFHDLRIIDKNEYKLKEASLSDTDLNINKDQIKRVNYSDLSNQYLSAIKKDQRRSEKALKEVDSSGAFLSKIKKGEKSLQRKIGENVCSFGHLKNPGFQQYYHLYIDLDRVLDREDFLKHLVINILLLLIIFELIRRSFYYIVLGSFNPKKK